MKVLTKTPIAINSPDHLSPVGCINDNFTNAGFVKEASDWVKVRCAKDCSQCKLPCGKCDKGCKPSMIDLGCAGGALAVDFLENGWDAIGLEGSDHPKKRGFGEWPNYGGRILFNADLTEEWKVVKGRKRAQVDLITAWEVMEHFERDKICYVIDTALEHLKPGGMIVGSIATHPDTRIGPNGTEYKLHQTVEPQNVWQEIILKDYNQIPYPFNAKVRTMRHGFSFAIRK